MSVPPAEEALAAAMLAAQAHVLHAITRWKAAGGDDAIVSTMARSGLIADIVEAAAQIIANGERERICQHAQEHAFRLYRPGNGPGAGQQAMDVVPLASLLEVL